jgi:hypothetical protein
MMWGIIPGMAAEAPGLEKLIAFAFGMDNTS